MKKRLNYVGRVGVLVFGAMINFVMNYCLKRFRNVICNLRF